MKSDNSSELLEQVRQQMGDGKFSRAFSTLKGLLASNPSHQEGRRLLATLLLKFGNLATAKNAFETLVKEALQRQDHQEAESLLREYLMAGPRCVPFLELLGATYELRGDPLAAVFEYEKAVDILLEDPDSDRPNYAQDLFQKIKQLAPSSFVANRVAARLQSLASPPPNPEPIDQESPSNRSSVVAHVENHDRVEETPDRNEIDTLSPPLQASATGPASFMSENEKAIEEQSAEGSSMSPADPVDKVPFPPVNRMAESWRERHEPSADESDEDEFGSAPAYEPDCVGFYPEEAASPSDPQPPAVPETTESVVRSRVESLPTFHRVENETRQDLYWARVMQGARPESADPSAASVSNETVKSVGHSQSKPHRGYARTIKTWLWFRLSVLIRSFIAATNSLTKLGLFICMAMVAWMVLIVGGTAALWLGLEQKPSETFQRLIEIAPTKTLEDWKNNGYILLMGFNATSSADPMQAGYDRWLSSNTEWATGCLDRATKGRSLVGVPSNAKKAADWFKTADPSAQFIAEGAQVKETLDPEGSLMSRYRRWLNLPFEDWGFNYLGSPDCGQVLTLHRLYVAEGFSQSVGAGLDRLEMDFTAWRKVLAQARTVSVKAMAIDGLNDDVAVMSGLLSRPSIDNKVIQRTMRLARPLDPEERSLRWPMQNEFALSVKRMEFRVRPQGDADSTAMLVAKMPLPKQRTLNTYALYYDALIKAAGVPNAHTPKLYEFSNTPARTWLDYGLNPIDNLILADPGQDWQSLQGSIIETDARLRLAGLQARLRVSSSEPIIGRIAQAGPNFFDPFTELPMLINAARGILYSVGSDRKDDGGDPTFDVSVPFIQ